MAWRISTRSRRFLPPPSETGRRGSSAKKSDGNGQLFMKRRFSTPDGRFVGWRKLPNALRSFYQALRRKLWGDIPRLPWIPFSAATALEAVLKPDWKVWEIGAGYSTLWLADRIHSVISIEASRDWFERLNAKIQSERVTNVDLRHEWRAEAMASFEGVVDGSLNLLFIDGGPRTECLKNGFSKVKSGGCVYLDNWENKGFWKGADSFLASVAEHIDKIQTFVDYVPAQVGVYEGMLIRKK